MTVVVLPSPWHALIGAAAFYLLYCIHWELTVGTSRRRLIAEKGCKPPKKWPTLDPILGLDFFFDQRRLIKEHRLLEAAVDRFGAMGNTWSTKAMGLKIIATVEPENLRHIQSLDFKNWALPQRRKDAFQPLFGRGIFTSDGAAWQHSREMLRPNFVRSQVGDLEAFETHVHHLIQAIPHDGSTVNLSDLFFRLTIDSATEFLFGESTLCLAPGTSTVSGAAFAEAFNRGQDAVGASFRLGPFAALARNAQFKNDIKHVHEFADGFVEKALANRTSILAEKARNPSARYVFLHELVTQTADKLQIRSELLNILLAGRDTTASLLTNVWSIISKRPDIWAKLRAEVATLGGAAPTYDQLKEMKYLRALLNESLRLHPVVPGNSREALVDTWLPVGGGEDGGSPIFVPKGTVASWTVYVMHRRKDLYGADAEEFRPERWLGDNGLRPGWEYLPFNGGPRICIGQQFALTEASYTTVRLMQHFKAIESRDDRPWTEQLALTCVNLYGCSVALTPAN